MSIESYESLIATISDSDAAIALKELQQELDPGPNLDALIKSYREQGVTLVLGAGVSASCGAPSWTALLLRLHVNAAQNRSVDLSGISDIYAKSVAADGPLISARLAAGGADDTTDSFKDLLRKEIYGPLTSGTSPLVKEIARLSQKNEGLAGVKAVLTYNYDTLLEDEFDAIGRHYRRLDRTDRGGETGIEVRHVHGFLGRNKLDNEWVVLTEGAYHTEYSNPFSWSNIVQLNSFRESCCVFIGLSMIDPNLRRLLEAANQTASPKHYCFLRRTAWAALENNLDITWEKRGRGRGKPSAAQKNQLANRFRIAAAMADSLRGEALREIGVHTIWYQEHNELPALIEKIRGGKR